MSKQAQVMISKRDAQRALQRSRASRARATRLDTSGVNPVTGRPGR